jgi:hypothetical protein
LTANGALAQGQNTFSNGTIPDFVALQKNNLWYISFMAKPKLVRKDICRFVGGKETSMKDSNCRVLGDGSKPGDRDHISTTTPLQTKIRELKNDPRYKTELVPDIDATRQKSTAKARRDGNVRPLGGGAAKR